MRRIHIKCKVSAGIATIITALLVAQLPALADTTNTPSLVISHIKITSSNGQFVTLYNMTDSAIDASKYQLVYFNNFDVSKATTSRLVALSGVVPPHSYELVTDSVTQLCFMVTVMSASLGFSSTAGFIELQNVSQSSIGSSITTTTQDFVGWSKAATNNAQVLPSSTNAFLMRNPVNAQNNPMIASAGDGTWIAVQPDLSSNCTYTSIVTNKPVIVYGATQTSITPPAIVETVSDTPIVAMNEGLEAPIITELLPNPSGTNNDTTDEFIELYNPNDTAYSLENYQLQTGLTTLHVYKFPISTMLLPRSFTAFYSETTGLSLSNTSSVAALLDPNGQVISQSGTYSTAKDGYAWVLVNGSWQWSIVATPAAANVLKQVAVSNAKKTVTNSKIGTLGSTKSGTHSQAVKSSAGLSASASIIPKTPLHPWILALVAVCAVLYGAYEFKSDIAHFIVRSRRYVSNRFGNWRAFNWWRSNRVSK